MSYRIFLALDIDESTRRRLGSIQSQLDDARSRINWVAPRNLHVTLKFLGDVADSLLPELCRAVSAAAGEGESFDFEVRGVRAIPPAPRNSGRGVRMLWAEVIDPTGRLARLFEQLETALHPLGFARENRSFSPHITLARVRFAGDPSALRAAAGELADEHFGRLRAEQLTIYTSQLQKGGPIYTPIANPPLG